MKARSGRVWLTFTFLAAAIPGCDTLWHGRTPYHEDPLLVSRKPVIGKPEEAKPHQLAYAEPSLPSLPAFAYVYPPVQSKFGAADSALAGKAPGQTQPPQTDADRTDRLKPSVNTDRRIQATPVLRRKVTGTFGYAPDYSWLQGRLRKSANGQWELRFCESRAGAAWGGRVLLAGDDRLEHFRDGDVIQVEGRPQVTVPPDVHRWETPVTYKVDRIFRIRG